MIKKKDFKTIVAIDNNSGKLIAKEMTNPYIELALMIKAEKGIDLFKEVEKIEGGESIVLDVDPLDPEAIEGAAIFIEKELAPIELWINPPFCEYQLCSSPVNFESYQKKVDGSVKIQIYGVLSALRRMIPRNKGRILFICQQNIPLFNSFNDSRKAIDALFQLIKQELHQKKSNIDLRYIQSPITLNDKINLYNRLPDKYFRYGGRFETAKLAIQGINYLLSGN